MSRSGDNARQREGREAPRTRRPDSEGRRENALEGEQADADRAATLADAAASARDQASADADQHPSYADQAAADRDNAAASTDPLSQLAYDTSRKEREGAAEHEGSAAARAGGALTRARAAIDRDRAARLRDLRAAARDRAADARDRASERHEELLKARAGSPEALLEALEHSAAARARAAADRARAATDRAQAAADRMQGAVDRRQARIDLHRAHFDDLTGAYTRGIGELALEHELERARRSGEPFVLAYVDVDDLKRVNDRHGHAAGDELLQSVAATIKSKLRPYDPIVRHGGDEFVCGFTNTGLEAASRRVEEIEEACAKAHPAGSISVGLAALAEGDTLSTLIARADEALYGAKATRPRAAS